MPIQQSLDSEFICSDIVMFDYDSFMAELLYVSSYSFIVTLLLTGFTLGVLL